MNNKKKIDYEEVKIEIVFFESKDVLTTSGFDGIWDEIEGEESDEKLK